MTCLLSHLFARAVQEDPTKAACLMPPLPAHLTPQVGKGQQVLGLELHDRRLLVTTADTTARVYLAHRPGEQRTSRWDARRAAAAGEPHQDGGAAQQAAGQLQQQQQVAPEEWQARSLGEAEAAARAAKPRNANSLFYDDSAAWLTLRFTLTNTLEKQPLRCAALSPGALGWWWGAAAGRGLHGCMIDNNRPSSLCRCVCYSETQHLCLLVPLKVQSAIAPADGEYFAAAHEGGGRQVIYLWECEAEARVNAVLEAPRWAGVGGG